MPSTPMNLLLYVDLNFCDFLSGLILTCKVYNCRFPSTYSRVSNACPHCNRTPIETSTYFHILNDWRDEIWYWLHRKRSRHDIEQLLYFVMIRNMSLEFV